MKTKIIFSVLIILTILSLSYINQLKSATTSDDIFMVNTKESIAIEDVNATSQSDKTKEINRSNAEILRIYSDRFPQLREAVIDPLDIKVGDIQKLTLKIEDQEGVSSVTAEIEHDNGKDNISLNLIDGNKNKGTWHGKWKAYNTHSKTYHTTFTAVNSKGKSNSITLAWSDPCSPPMGGDWTLDGNCTITSTTGVDNGNFTVASPYTLTISDDGLFVFNKGKKMIMRGGTITIIKGGRGHHIKKTNLWMKDSDGDLYGDQAIIGQVAQDNSPGAGYVRRYTLMGANDCYDANANAKPGQTNYFTTNRGDGSFDYDCNGAEERQSGVCDNAVCTKYGGFCPGGCAWSDRAVPPFTTCVMTTVPSGCGEWNPYMCEATAWKTKDCMNYSSAQEVFTGTFNACNPTGIASGNQGGRTCGPAGLYRKTCACK